MLDSILTAQTGITLGQILICAAVSLALGVIISLAYMFKNPANKSFIMTLVLLPMIIQSVIMVVNGNLGAGVAVMGAFSLVRFRSVPGSSREIAAIFFAMAAGLAAGMGYVAYAVLFTLMVAGVMLLFTALNFGGGVEGEKSLRVTIPEDLDYSHLLDDVFRRYASNARLDKVKTANLGSLFELQYTITLKDNNEEKAMLDEIRMRNGNLNIACGMKALQRDETL